MLRRSGRPQNLEPIGALRWLPLSDTGSCLPSAIPEYGDAGGELGRKAGMRVGGYARLRVSETAEMLCSGDPAADWTGGEAEDQTYPGV